MAIVELYERVIGTGVLQPEAKAGTKYLVELAGSDQKAQSVRMYGQQGRSKKTAKSKSCYEEKE